MPSPSTVGNNGTDNTGGGGGGIGFGPSYGGRGGNGGSGIVLTKELNNNRGNWPLSQQFDAQESGSWPDGTVIQWHYL